MGSISSRSYTWTGKIKDFFSIFACWVLQVQSFVNLDFTQHHPGAYFWFTLLDVTQYTSLTVRVHVPYLYQFLDCMYLSLGKQKFRVIVMALSHLADERCDARFSTMTSDKTTATRADSINALHLNRWHPGGARSLRPTRDASPLRSQQLFSMSSVWESRVSNTTDCLLDRLFQPIEVFNCAHHGFLRWLKWLEKWRYYNFLGN